MKSIFFRPLLALCAAFLCAFTGVRCIAATYYVHPTAGIDQQPGTSPSAPWRTLAKANAASLQPGDRVLLAAGQTFEGQLFFTGLNGTAEAPIILSSYAPAGVTGETRATIDARGYVAAVRLKNSRHVRVADLVLTADGGGLRAGQPPKADLRCGVLVEADAPGSYEGFHLHRLLARNVAFEDAGFVRPASDVNTPNGTLRYGWGIRFMVTSAEAQLSRIRVTDCEIRDVNHTGLKFTAPTNGIQDVRVERVRVLNSGGPGVQMSGVRGGVFTALHVDGSGSTKDTRNWGRGSGLWTWGTSDVVIERSQFLNANGPGDSAGVHIDFNCRNVIVQYNLSANNAGGFCEILGNNFNCAYRYNVSVNDGHRVKGKDGAFQDGKTFWLSGYTGGKSPRRGPINTYFYNNTIFVGDHIVAKVAVAPTAEGVLIANNIFHFTGRSQMVLGDQSRPDSRAGGPLKNVVFANNLFLRSDTWPEDIGIKDRAPLFGDAKFAQSGGLKLTDYTPQNIALIKDRGVTIAHLPDDPIGLATGLAAAHDVLDRAIAGQPDLGAIELP